MDLSHAKNLFKHGRLKTATVIPASSVDSVIDYWKLIIEDTLGQKLIITMTRDNSLRKYKRYEGAVSDAQKIGFKNVEIIFN